MIWVSLQSELPWQSNEAITFFIHLCVSLYQEFFFLAYRLREYHGLSYLPQLWQSLNKFYESVLEIFRNEVLRVIETVK